MREVPRIVVDSNVMVAAVRSRRGASFRLLSLIDSGRFRIAISVALVLEYEDAIKRMLNDLALSEAAVDAILDYVCSVAERRRIHYLWRPCLPDPKDDMVLELAVSAGCEAIVTFNRRDFAPAAKFGIRVLTPREFLDEIGALR